MTTIGDRRFGALGTGYGGRRTEPAITARRAVVGTAGVGAGVWCVVTPWPLTPPAWLAAVAAVLCGLTVVALLLLVRAAFRLVGRVLAGRTPVLRSPGGALVGLVVVAVAMPPQVSPVVEPVRAVSAGGVSAGGGSVGAEGRAFLDLPVSTPVTPIRAYIARGAAADDAGRAALAVESLRRAGGPARGTVLVVVPTGSGWVDGAAVTTLEERLGGDVATVAVQYAERPSWLEYLLGGEAAGRSAAAVVAAVRAALPPDGPRLLLFGESLGAIAALPLAPLVDGCLLAGRPGSAGDGPTGCTELRNADDPVVRWSTRLDPVTFWQVTASLLIAQDAGPDHGHRYGPSFGAGWARADGPRP